MPDTPIELPVELRSDTFTTPTHPMRHAMARSAVGDDVYGEDPTVNELEAEVAALFGHEAAVFVPSGTMGNLVALRTVCEPGAEVVADADAHIVSYELGGLAAIAGIQTRTVTGPAGLLDPATVRATIRPAGYGTVVTSAVAVEQTHNRGGGSVHPLVTLQELRALTRDVGVALHCDGARIWNAAVATGTPLTAYGACFDTLSVCLSKGLGAPVGSLIVTDAARAAHARIWRKRLGGGMRQAGVLAAAGLVAVRDRERLAEDHVRAARLAEALGLPAPQTNIVSFAVDSSDRVIAGAAAAGVLVGAMGPRTVRLVTHYGVDDAGIERAVEVLAPLLADGARRG